MGIYRSMISIHLCISLIEERLHYLHQASINSIEVKQPPAMRKVAKYLT